MIRTTTASGQRGTERRLDGPVALAVIVLGSICLVGDLASATAAWMIGRGFRWVPVRSLPAVVGAVVLRLGSVGAPVPRTAATPAAAPGWLVGAVFASLVGAPAIAVLALRRTKAHPPRRRSPGPAEWATRRSAKGLLIRSARPGRLVVGRFGGALVATEANHSLLVVGPTQSGKTSGLVIPALLEWDGPVVATSVKRDLLEATIARRVTLGEVAVYDPTGSSGVGSAAWDPLEAAHEWAGAKRVAANLCGVARSGAGNLEDGTFWYSTAEKLLAPLLFAAANTGRDIADVVRWIDLRLTEEPIAALVDLDVAAAWQAAVASFDRDDRQLSSVYATVESVLAAFTDPGVLATARRGGFAPRRFVSGGSPTLFLVAPARTQERLAPVFVALLGEVLEAAFERAGAAGAGRLLVVLDEAANIAPVRDLDVLASTAAGHGIQLVTVFQDLSQIDARYGPKAATVVNNHRARLLCSGIADPKTLGEMSTLLGEAESVVRSTSETDHQVTTTLAPERRPLASSDALRRIEPGDGVLVYGHLPPVRVRLRPWFADTRLRRLSLLGGGRKGAREKI